MSVVQMSQVRVSTLADKAMLARLSRRSLSTTVRDKALEQSVRSSTGDDSITVSKHLFKDKGCEVRKLITQYDEVYRLHIENTMPWIDRGPRLLPSRNYFKYMETMRAAIEKVDKQVPTIRDRWDYLVAQDIARRGGSACVQDYPPAYRVLEAFSVDLQILPLPDTGDFRVDVDEGTRESLRTALEQAEQAARADIIRRMLEPVTKAAEKLATPIGDTGSVFRNSLIHNVYDGIAQAKQLNISDDPELAKQIELIEHKMREVAAPTATEALRTSQARRDKAKAALDDIMGNLGQL